MTLTLTVLRCPDAVPPETRQISGGEFRIGRGPDNDWIMPDPERLLSKRHCVIAFRNGGWAIADISTNGTYLNRDAEPIGNGQIRDLRDGDRIRFGAYEIETRIADVQGFGAAASGFGRSSSPFDDPFGGDVFAPAPPPADNFTSAAFGANDPLFGGPARPASVTMPDHFDPLSGPDGDFLGAPTQPDHSPSFSDAFRAPAARQVLPEEDDWDLSLPAAPATPARGFAPPSPPPLPPASSLPAEDPWAAPAAPPIAQPSPFDEPAPFSQPAPLPPRPVPEAANPFAEAVDFKPAAPPPEPPRAAAPAPVAPPAPQAAPGGAPGGDALLAAFLKGAGLEGTAPANPEALMQALGATFRALVSGIRQALIARATIKGEFRIEQTMIRARGNNPLKFSADDDDALTALLGLGRRVDMGPDAAVSDALRDMRLHELATMAAMQDAVRALLAQLDPARLRAEAEGGGMTLLPAQKKARAFDAYEKLHETITRALADDFDSVFGKSFARAYETALREISAREISVGEPS